MSGYNEQMNGLFKNKIILSVICLGIIIIFGGSVNAQRLGGKSAFRKTQRARIEIVAGGYRPEEFRLKKGVPARVTFIRRTEDECGEEVVFPEYNIRRKLPVNRPVTIAFTPQKSGAFNFTCGMDMMRGKVIVQ